VERSVTGTGWIWPALAGQVAFAGATFIDRAARARRRSTPDAVVAGSAVVHLVVGTVLLVLVGTRQVGVGDQVLMLGAGALLYLHVVPYRRALRNDDVSVVGPMFQMVPVFVLALSWSLLGQRLGQHQVIGFVVVFAGAALFMHGDADGSLLVRQTTANLMIVSSLLLAAEITLLGWLLQRHSVADTLPLVVVGLGVAGVLALARQPSRRAVLGDLGRSGWLGVSVAGVLVLGGEALLARALAAGPVAAVAATAAVEAPCLLLIGLLVGRAAPWVQRRERFARPAVLLRVCAAELLVGGLFLLVR
jgi:drug/metabolite transporter (DMT)-like permease